MLNQKILKWGYSGTNMPELNANIPPIECYVRGNFLRNQEDSHDKYFPCVIFGVAVGKSINSLRMNGQLNKLYFHRVNGMIDKLYFH